MHTIDRTRPRVVHPCERFATTIGFKTWAAALEAMNDGQVLAGPMDSIQPATKSNWGIKLFMEVVEKEKLHIYVPEGVSMVVVGHLKNFPADVLALQEEQAAKIAKYLMRLTPAATPQ